MLAVGALLSGQASFSTEISRKTSLVLESVEFLQKELEPYEINIFPAFIPGMKGKYAVNGIIKMPKKEWPDERVLNILKTLPPNFSINIDPEILL